MKHTINVLIVHKLIVYLVWQTNVAVHKLEQLLKSHIYITYYNTMIYKKSKVTSFRHVAAILKKKPWLFLSQLQIFFSS